MRALGLCASSAASAAMYSASVPCRPATPPTMPKTSSPGWNAVTLRHDSTTPAMSIPRIAGKWLPRVTALSGADFRVEWIDPTGGDLDEDLPGCRHRCGDVDFAKWAVGSFYDVGFHGAPSFWCALLLETKSGFSDSWQRCRCEAEEEAFALRHFFWRCRRLVVCDVVESLVHGVWARCYDFDGDWFVWNAASKPVWVVALLPCNECEDESRELVAGHGRFLFAIEGGHGVSRGVDKQGDGAPREGIEGKAGWERGGCIVEDSSRRVRRY